MGEGRSEEGDSQIPYISPPLDPLWKRLVNNKQNKVKQNQKPKPKTKTSLVPTSLVARRSLKISSMKN